MTTYITDTKTKKEFRQRVEGGYEERVHNPSIIGSADETAPLIFNLNHELGFHVIDVPSNRQRLWEGKFWVTNQRRTWFAQVELNATTSGSTIAKVR